MMACGARCGLSCLLLLLLVFLCAAPPARARIKLDLRQRYEEEIIAWALRQSGLVRESSPAGKIIERIEIVREDIIAESDPWPRLLNYLHVKTKDFVVRQELLLQAGDVWNEALVAESARNLRSLFTLAVVRTVPCRSTRPGHVILLLVTKDLWSIRLNMIWKQVGDTFQLLDINPTEMNFLGRNKRLGLHVRLQQLDLQTFTLRDQLALGETYVDERLLGSRLRLVQRFDAYLAGEVPCAGALGDREEIWCPGSSMGELEGAYTYLGLERPLFSLGTRWAFHIYGLLDLRQVRSYDQVSRSLKATAFGDHPDGLKRMVPRVYDRRWLTGSAGLVRSFGTRTKHNVTTGLTTYQYRYTIPDGFPFDPDGRGITRHWFQETALPQNENVSFLYFGYQTLATRYIRLRNIQTFGLTEDFLLGHSFYLQARFATDLDEPSGGFLEGVMHAAYRWFFLDNMLTMQLQARARYQPRLLPAEYRGPLANVLLWASVKNTFPAFLWGRFHVQVSSVQRHNDYLVSFYPTGTSSDPFNLPYSTLGGDSGLRGFPADHFEGQNLVLFNVEYRSEPITLFTIHAGLVLFYDGGAVYGPEDSQWPDQHPFVYRQSVGLGVRGLIPQLDKEPMRLDFGIPISGDREPVGTWFSVSFRQVF